MTRTAVLQKIEAALREAEKYRLSQSTADFYLDVARIWTKVYASMRSS